MPADVTAEVDRLTDLALALPPALRELVAYRIWESLHPEESWPLAPEQLEEIRRRATEVEAGTVELVDGDDVLREARARIDARRR
ncbi:addiction module protein [Sorangium sp. So ce131]|uniref:addiction module protein n=1 Tax=Sorangium sp. So ce131 TaxID=3133282 RepID=UPI003F6000D9